MKGEHWMMRKGFSALCRLLYACMSSTAAFVFAAFVVYGVLSMGPLYPIKAQVTLVERYLIEPWGTVLCVLFLQRQAQRMDAAPRRELPVLLALLLWIIVPFVYRFGMTADNAYTGHSWAVVFFGVYALTSGSDAAYRERIVDTASALFAAVSFVLGALLLYTAVTVQEWGSVGGSTGFGVHNASQLCMGMHHNSSGAACLFACLMSAIGFFRRKSAAARLAHLIPALMMGAAVVLTQSRTARYCLLAALALGCYGVVAGSERIRNALLRHAAGVALGAAVLAAGYMSAAWMTDAALEHYARLGTGRQISASVQVIRPAAAEENAQKDGQNAKQETQRNTAAKKARGAGDMSFTGRTLIWRNALKLCRENPKHFLLGFGVGRVGRMIVQGTLVEKDGYSTTHNSYLQFIMDFGLVGFAMIAMYLGMLVPPCLRIFFARGKRQVAGYRALCTMVVGALLTGMMESLTLTAMTTMNLMLFFPLALIAGRDRDIQSLV